MSRLRVPEALAERWGEMRERLLAAYDHFRESRLYVQTICAAVLVGAASLVHLLPYGPLARVDAAVAWAVAEDYDFRGKASQANEWARSQGGWQPAMAGLWRQEIGHVRDWVGPVGPFAPQQAIPAAPADPLPGPGVAESTPPGSVAGDGAGVAMPPVPQVPLQPVDGSVLAEYGWLPQSVSEEFHEGIDLYTRPGAPVVAVLGGTVQAVRQDPRLGTVVEVRHGNVIAVYAQVEGVAVRAGDGVTRGQKLATVARSRGFEQEMPPHLHFEIRPVSTGEPVDPASYLGLGGKKL